MSDQSGFDFLRFRDGTSQERRISRALDPGYFKLDERSLEDLIVFAQRFAKTLNYYDRNNQITGDWSTFLESHPSLTKEEALKEVVDYLNNPGRYANEANIKARYAQPHIALFLAFLSLLQEAQQQMNTLTKRQLDFYFRQALKLQPQSGRADQVHLLARLEPDSPQVLIPKGTLLLAGENQEGTPIHYETDVEVLANQAKVKQIMSLHVEKDIQTLPILRARDYSNSVEAKDTLLKMLKMVYKKPGTDNSPRQYPNALGHRTLDNDLLTELDELYKLIYKDESPPATDAATGLSSFHLKMPTFLQVIELYKAWENPLNWRRSGLKRGINDYLAEAADHLCRPFDLASLEDPLNFDQNVELALGVTAEDWNAIKNDEGQSIVKDIHDLYFEYQRRKIGQGHKNPDDPVVQKIYELGFRKTEDFEAMMKIRMTSLEYLKEIIRILKTAVREAGGKLGNEAVNAFQYLKANTLSNLFKKIYQLDTEGDHIVYPRKDKEKLTISIPADSSANTVEQVKKEWLEAEKGEFQITFPANEKLSLKELFFEDPNADQTLSLSKRKRFRGQLLGDTPGKFISIKYDGEVETPEVVVEKIPLVEFEILPDVPKLNIKVKSFPIPGAVVQSAWNSFSKCSDGWKDGFKLTTVIDLGTVEVPEKGKELPYKNRMFKLAEKNGNFISIVYDGELFPASTNLPKVVLEHSSDSAIQFDATTELGLLTITLPASTLGADIQKAWDAHVLDQPANRGDFYLESVGPVGNLNDADAGPITLEGGFFTLPTDGNPTNFIKVEFGAAGSHLSIVDGTTGAAPSATEIFDLSIPSRLKIKITETFKAVDEIKPLWEQLTENKGFSLEFPSETDFNLITSAPLLLQEQNEFYGQLPLNKTGSFLGMYYLGSSKAPSVKVNQLLSAGDVAFEFAKGGKLVINLPLNLWPVHNVLAEWNMLRDKNEVAEIEEWEMVVFTEDFSLDRLFDKLNTLGGADKLRLAQTLIDNHTAAAVKLTNQLKSLARLAEIIINFEDFPTANIEQKVEDLESLELGETADLDLIRIREIVKELQPPEEGDGPPALSFEKIKQKLEALQEKVNQPFDNKRSLNQGELKLMESLRLTVDTQVNAAEQLSTELEELDGLISSLTHKWEELTTKLVEETLLSPEEKPGWVRLKTDLEGVDVSASGMIDFNMSDLKGRLSELRNLVEGQADEFEQLENSFKPFQEPGLKVSESKMVELDRIQVHTAQLPTDESSSEHLHVRYTGLSSIPKVTISLDDVGSAQFQLSSTGYQDDFFKVKAGQLGQIQEYFKMQADDFYFMQQLFLIEGELADPNQDAWKWRRVDGLLEEAHRKLFNENAVPEIIKWNNLFIAPQADKALVQGFGEEQGFSRWKTFGRSILASAGHGEEALDLAQIPSESPIQAGEIGLMIASPTLSMQEGRRTIELLLNFDKASFDYEQLRAFFLLEHDPDGTGFKRPELFPFAISISTQKEWYLISDWEDVDLFEATAEEDPAIRIQLLLNEDAPPVAPVEGDPTAGPWPALRLVLKTIPAYEAGGLEFAPRHPYDAFKGLLLKRIVLKVGVVGLKNIQAQNLQGSIDPKMPFTPFGPRPQIGDRFFLTHPEIAGQRLESLKVNISWKNLPEKGLLDYYQAYTFIGKDIGIPEINNDSFHIDMRLTEAHRSLDMPFADPFADSPERLDPDHPTPHRLFGDISWKSTTYEHDETFSPGGADYGRLTNPQMHENILESDRYLELELAGQDFLHNRFPTLLTRQAILKQNAGMLTESAVAKKLEDNIFTIQLAGFPKAGLTTDDFQVSKKTGGEITIRKYNAATRTIDFDWHPNAKAINIISKEVRRDYKANVTFPVKQENERDSESGAQEIEVSFVENSFPNTGTIRLPENLADDALTADLTVKDLEGGAIKAFTLNHGVITFPVTTKGNVIDEPADPFEVEVAYPGPTPIILEPPYTPIAEGLSIDYQASVDIILASDRPTVATDQVLHLHPFGTSELEKSTREGAIGFPLIPHYEDEGELYLGIEGLQPPQTLSLLFQMAEGSGDSNLSPPFVQWSYLAGHEWKPLLGKHLRLDATNGLLDSGMVQLDITQTSLDHSRMPAGLSWIKASVRRNSLAINDTIAVHAQAVRATLVEESVSVNQRQVVLPPGTITEPQSSIRGLIDFIQPYTSFHGKAQETEAAFYRRASERLRHKSRALTMWDYERLVLEKFSDIYKVKALSTDLLDVDATPGSVTVLVIPDIRAGRPFDPFEPKVPLNRLTEIQHFLRQLAPPFADVQVKNPRFNYLHVRTPVKFLDMNNFEFYRDKLNKDLQQYLSPWAFDSGSEITFGQDVYLSVIVHFIESRSYVDFVDQPKLILKERDIADGLLHPVRGVEAVKLEGKVQISSPDIILVSDAEHSIDYLDDSIPPSERVFSGIGYAKVDLDFEVIEGTPEETG